MKEFNKTVNLISYTIGEVSEKDLNSAIYGKCIEDLEEYLEIKEDSKLNVLDLFASSSYVQENQKDWMDYKSLDSVKNYQRNGEDEVKIDLVCDVNKISIKKREFEIIFTIGAKSFFGINHQSLFEVERIIKSEGLLVVSMSKYFYYKELASILLGYREWEITRACEVSYQILESKIDSSKFFVFYTFKG